MEKFSAIKKKSIPKYNGWKIVSQSRLKGDQKSNESKNTFLVVIHKLENRQNFVDKTKNLYLVFILG